MLLEQSVRFKESWTCVARQQWARQRLATKLHFIFKLALMISFCHIKCVRNFNKTLSANKFSNNHLRIYYFSSPCRLTTYRHRFARAAPAPRAKRSKNRGCASPVKHCARRYGTLDMCELGDLSEFLAARAHARHAGLTTSR